MLWLLYFTRVPYLYLPSQQLALVTNTWISLLEKIYKIIFMKTIINKIPYNQTNYLVNLKNQLYCLTECNKWHNIMKN